MKTLYTKIIILSLLSFLGTGLSFGQTTIAEQDFDAATSWNYSSDVTYFSHEGSNTNNNVYPLPDGWSGDGFYGIIDINDASGLDYVNLSSNILGERDLDDEGDFGTSGDATTTFTSIDVSSYTNVEVSFDYDIEGYNANADEAFYEIFHDGVGQGRVTLQTGSTPGDDAEGSETISVPNSVNSIELEIIVNNNGASGYSGFDNFEVVGTASGPSVGFDLASSTEDETNSTFNVLIPVTLSNFSSNVDLSVSVDGASTAEVGDYTLNTSTLNFTSGGTQNVSLDINSDAGFDDETIILNLAETTSPTTGITISTSQHTVTVNDDELPPSLTLSETTLSDLDYVDGNGPSSEQTFSAEGSDLTTDITLTAPTNFEISTTSGSGFGTSVALTPSSGSVPATTIYVRLAASLAVNTYSGTLTATSTGATQQDISLSGEVTAAPPANDDCGNAIALVNNDPAISGTLEAATEAAPFIGSGKDVWYSITPTYDETYTITLSNFSGDADLYLYDQSNSCPTTTTDIASSTTTSATESISEILTSGTTYYISVVAYDAAAENTFDIEVTAPPETTRVNFANASTSVNEGDGTVDIDLTITNEDATNATSVDVALTTGDAADIDNYTTQTLTFPAGSSANQTLTITLTDDALDEADETLTFTLQNISGGNNAQIGTQNTFDLTIEDNDLPTPINLPYNEDFSNCGNAEWVTFDEAGGESWACGSGEFAMNGFDDGTGNDIDWLISNFRINFDDYSTVNIDVLTSEQFGGTVNEPGEFRLAYSTDYDGAGNPTGFTWSDLTFDPNNTSTGFGLSTPSTTSVDASSVTGIAYIAFIYDETVPGADTEDWRVQQVDITGSLVTTNDTDTEVFESSTQVSASTQIAADATSAANSFPVLGFVVEDQGSGDGLPTEITRMRFVPGPNNTADWSDHIQGITLDDISNSYTPSSINISDTEIVLDFATPISVVDGASNSIEFELGVYLNTTNILDGGVLQFQIDGSSSGFQADASGSGFADPFLLGDVVGNNHTIDIDATQLSYITQPSNVNVNAVISPSVEIAYTDVNGLVDVDYDGTGFDISLITTGSFDVSSTIIETASNGIATFSNLIFDATATGIILTATDDSTFIAGDYDSNSFDVASASAIFEDFNDGDFTANPVWTGSTSSFSVITDATIPSGNASTDASFLASNSSTGDVSLAVESTEVDEWRFSLASPNFNPSSSNIFGVVLMADASFSGELSTNNFEGYFIRIGTNGGTDPIELWRKTGAGDAKIGDFPSSPNFGTGALRDGLDIRITRSATGEFELFYNTGFEYSTTPTNSAGTLTDNSYSTSAYFGVYQNISNPSSDRRVYIDNIDLGSSPPTAPAITLSESTISALDYVDGSGPSAEQTFTAEGSNLTADITINAPTDFEVSTTSGSGFGPSVTLPQSGGSVAATTIFVRLAAGLAVNTYSGTLSATSTGATQQDVSLSGEVTASGGGTACGVEIDFETQGVGYSTSITEFSDGSGDYFTQTDGTNISSGISFNNTDGSFFAAQDIDGEGATLPVELTIDNIDISTLTNLEFSIDLAEDGSSGSDHWDNSDYVRIYYTIDSGTEQNLLWIQNDGSTFNTAPLIDTDFDGVGDGTEITDTFATFTESIAGTGTTMDIRIEFNLDSGDEDIALDNISVCGTQLSTTYTYTDDITGWNINPVTGTPPSTIADNIEVLAGTAVLDGVIEGKNLSVSSGATLELGINAVLSLDGDITNDGTILFKSDSNGTAPATRSAQIDTFTGTISGSGEVTVERYIPAKRAFRLLASPVTTTDFIYENWQENGSTPATPDGLGTHITGGAASLGFDQSGTNNPSMFTFNNANQDWDELLNTNATKLNAETPYLTMVRGDRSINLFSNSSDPKETTLRATGELFTGSSSPVLSTGFTDYSLVANPYQAVVDYSLATRTNLTNSIYIWDASIGGANGRGGYVTVDVSSNTITDPTPPPSSTDASKYIAPGMSFFVQNNFSASPSLTINEDDKATVENQVAVFSTNPMFYINSRLYLTSDLQDGYSERDAIGLRFSTDFTTPGSLEDGSKLTNPDENYAVMNNGLKSIDYQNLPVDGHSIDLYVANYTVTDYSLTYDIENKPEGIDIILVDAYLGTQTTLTDNVVYNFSIDSNIPESIATDRFSLIFNQTTFSTSDNEFGSDFSLYPNPAQNGVFSIKTPNISGEVSVEISSLLGQQVYKQTLSVEAQEVKVSAEHLSSGLYMVKLTQDGQSFTTKLMVE